MKKVLWFSRHDMTAEQAAEFQDCEIVKVSGSPENVYSPFEGTINGVSQIISSMRELVWNVDLVAIVAPIGLQKQFLDIAGEKPVIYAKTRREVLENGEKVIFNFDGWEQLVKIEVITKPFTW